ncbi:MAG: carbon monoxide dehydrogenase subunit G [Chloroflexota bacterium]|jgi:carbon monoxide dehydrogenase subunit G
MKVEGTYTFKAPREEVWTAMLDPEVLSNTLPGIQQLEQTGENVYKAAMKIRIGPVQGVYTGTVNLSDLNPPEYLQLHVDGRGAPGFVKGDGELRLEADGDQTLMHYGGDAQVGGRLASVGQRLMESSVQALIGQSLESLNAQIAARVRGQETGEAVEPVAPPSELDFATGVAQRMLDDMLPAEQRKTLVKGAVSVLVTLFFLRMVSNWWIDRTAHRVADILESRQRSSQ